MQPFSQQELLRYQRHFPVIGLTGQQKLKKAKVLCVGGGGLGCPALQYLAAAGVGTLGIMDGDTIELSNLQRQILFNENDIGRNKAVVIAEQLSKLNSHISTNVYSIFLSDANATEIISTYDVILDATDNYKSRYLLNSVCRKFKKPLISASIFQFDAQLSVFNYENGPCYQCLYPEPPPASLSPNCALGGVLGVLPGVAGTLQATETIKVILNLSGVASGVLLSLDLLSLRFNQYEIIKQDCQRHPDIHFEQSPTDLTLLPTISAQALASLLADATNLQLVDVRQPYEREICHIGGFHIPLPEFESQLQQLKKNLPTIVYCKSGGRSATACDILLSAGFNDVRYLKQGILGWIETVDNTLMHY